MIYSITQKYSVASPILNNEEATTLGEYQTQFDTKQQLDAIFGLSVSRFIKKSIECYIQPYYQHAFSSPTKSTSISDVKHNYSGVKIGVRINLSEK